ncbi:uropathogenic specific protein [Agrobacterium tumefaciens]|uniref:PAAR domain-containing protein n=1 Tax=Agrobacterium tumefaciens TaxID=358 RepID=UPI0021D0E058|nr:PAAR domain-containing protein [Agrobacterium tumefaciens]UXT51855.1 uropathogenic specific protein [Agrobacterium tumefaciens]
MPPAHRQNDIGSGHGCHFPPSNATGGSPTVFINGKPAMRVGDSYAAHTCPKHGGGHGRALAEGSASVSINGRPAGRIDDAIDCGGTAQTGSSNVSIGDGGSGGTTCQTAQSRQASLSVRG